MGKLYTRQAKKDDHKYEVRVEYYHSANDVADDAKYRKITDNEFKDYSKKGNIDSHWTGCDSYEQALEYLRTGYEPIVKDLEREYKLNAKGGESKRITFKNDIMGYNPIVPLAMQGVPNSMVNMTMKPIKTKVVDIYYDMSVNANVSNSEILQCGTDILSVILDLEKQGYRFNLYAFQTYNDTTDCDCLIVKIKDARQPLDLRRMSFPLCHTGFFRIIGFDWYSRTPNAKYRWGYGTELTRILNDEEIDYFNKVVLGDNAVALRADKLVHNDDSEERKKYIKGVLTNVRKTSAK